MSLAFDLAVEPSPAVGRLLGAAHALGLGAAMLAGAYLVQHGVPFLAALAVVTALLGVGASALRARRRAPLGWLTVDASGRAQWFRGASPRAGYAARAAQAVQAAHGTGADASPAGPGEAFVPARWFRLGPVTWLEGRAGPRLVHLILGADRSSEDTWRRLAAWLLWLERGGAPGPR